MDLNYIEHISSGKHSSISQCQRLQHVGGVQFVAPPARLLHGLSLNNSWLMDDHRTGRCGLPHLPTSPGHGHPPQYRRPWQILHVNAINITTHDVRSPHEASAPHFSPHVIPDKHSSLTNDRY